MQLLLTFPLRGRLLHTLVRNAIMTEHQMLVIHASSLLNVVFSDSGSMLVVACTARIHSCIHSYVQRVERELYFE